jgi:sarcosine oxidase delta subunit
MARKSKHPVILNDLIFLSVSDLRKKKLLKPNTHESRKISWKGNGVLGADQEAASINLIVNTTYGSNYLQLDYEVNGKPYSYRIEIEYLPSNLGYGAVPYLICPYCGKRSLKLFLHQGYFINRTAIEDANYRAHVISKQFREAASLGKKIKRLQKAYGMVQEKYFRAKYDGMPTKRQRDFEMACLELKVMGRRIN